MVGNLSVVGQTRLVGANHCPKGECPWQVSTALPLLLDHWTIKM